MKEKPLKPGVYWCPRKSETPWHVLLPGGVSCLCGLRPSVRWKREDFVVADPTFDPAMHMLITYKLCKSCREQVLSLSYPAAITNLARIASVHRIRGENLDWALATTTFLAWSTPRR